MATDRIYTLAEGQPFAQNDVGIQLRNTKGGGYALLQDTQLIETLAHGECHLCPQILVDATG
jgi:catalase